MKEQPAMVKNSLQNNTQTNVWEQSEWLLTEKLQNATKNRLKKKSPLEIFELKCQQSRLF